jgi:choline kinase
MKAVILAAGQGKRFVVMTRKVIPKCLLPIGSETILERQLSILQALGIREIVTVIGNQGCWDKDSRQKVEAICHNVVVNDKCLVTQSPYSLYLGLQFFTTRSPVIAIDGDLVFQNEVIEELLADRRENVLVTRAIESRAINNKGSKVISRKKDGRVVASKNNIPSYELYSGICKVGEDTFELLKDIVSQEKHWNQEMAYPLQTLSKRCQLYSLYLNTGLSAVTADLYSGDASWEGEPQMIEKRGPLIRKSARIGEQKLINEVNYILNLPSELKNYFPEVTKYDFSSSPVYYEMKYCPYPSLKSLLFDQAISIMEAGNILEKVLDFMFSKVYTRNLTPTPLGYIRNCYSGKIRSRMQAAKSKSRMFDKIMEAPNLLINGVESKNVSTLLEEIDTNIKFLSKLEPPFVCLTHGDFKLDNILVDTGSGDFVLIDPRGKSPIGLDVDDPIADMAKLFTSCHGLYDLFYEDMFDLDIDEPPTTINIKFHSPKLVKDLDGICQTLLKILPKYPQLRKDKNWRKRLLFSEAMLIIANAPFHLVLVTPREERFAIGLYARGLQLLNEFLQQFPLDKDQKYYIINVNAQSDYERAKEVAELAL